jgi:LacI family transcriptional regulator
MSFAAKWIDLQGGKPEIYRLQEIPMPKQTKPPLERPTIYDVARHAGVSPATVSNVQRGVKTVSLENVHKVKEAVLTLGYRRDQRAANLRSSRGALIGLIIPDFANPFYGALVAACEKLADAEGFRLVAVSNHDDFENEVRHIQELIDWRVAGLMIVPRTAQVPGIDALIADGVPTVVLDRVMEGCPFDSVDVDNSESCGQMVQKFYAAGHRHLLVVATSLVLPNMQARLDGVISAAAQMPERMEIEVIRSGLDLESATRVMVQRFETGPLPTAIFSLFIQGTLASLREITRCELSIPDQISLAGFDDFEWMQVIHPPVAAVIQPVAGLAQTAMRLLTDRMAAPLQKPRHAQLACTLQSRGSIGRIHRR